MHTNQKLFLSSVNENGSPTNTVELQPCRYVSHVLLSHTSICCYCLATLLMNESNWTSQSLTSAWMDLFFPAEWPHILIMHRVKAISERCEHLASCINWLITMHTKWEPRLKAILTASPSDISDFVLSCCCCVFSGSSQKFCIRMSFEIKFRFAALTAVNMSHNYEFQPCCVWLWFLFRSLCIIGNDDNKWAFFFLLLNKNSHPGSLESFTMNLNITD